MTVETPNRAQETVGSILDMALKPGERASFDPSSYFSDPDGDFRPLSGLTITSSGPSGSGASPTVDAFAATWW